MKRCQERFLRAESIPKEDEYPVQRYDIAADYSQMVFTKVLSLMSTIDKNKDDQDILAQNRIEKGEDQLELIQAPVQALSQHYHNEESNMMGTDFTVEDFENSCTESELEEDEAER